MTFWESSPHEKWLAPFFPPKMLMVDVDAGVVIELTFSITK